MYGHLGQEAVDVIDCEEESFPLKFVLLCYLNQPIDEDGPHSHGDVLLAPHESWARPVLVLKQNQAEFGYYFNVLSAIQGCLKTVF